MKVDGVHYRTIWLNRDGWSVSVIDQTRLPHSFEVVQIQNADKAVSAIKAMVVRGAPLIGAMAAYGLALALREDASDRNIAAAREKLKSARPTAVNLVWALERLTSTVACFPLRQRAARAYEEAAKICDEDVATCRAIAGYGEPLIRDISRWTNGRPVNILTHCNAGWLATVDWGTALSPIYAAHDAGIPVHVWVDETRPRNQGASLTAWELGKHGVPHTIVADNAGGHLMRQRKVDMCLTGTDRVASNGDVVNKIGTYLKALAAKDNGVPFYVALPGTTIDWNMDFGDLVPIEERGAEEVTCVVGIAADGTLTHVRLTPEGSKVANPAFDITPARLVTGFITERGICDASGTGLNDLYANRKEPASF